MAYDVPTAASLKALYPAFAAVADATIDAHLTRASTEAADTSWPEAEYGPAVIDYAAHRMALLDIGAHGEVAGYVQAGVTGIKTGNFEARFNERTVGKASAGKLDATPYGRAYQAALHRVKGGPRVLGGVRPDGGWFPTGRTNDLTPLP